MTDIEPVGTGSAWTFEEIRDQSILVRHKINEVVAKMNSLTAVYGRNHLLEEALVLLSKDMHSASSRPCSTCQVVSNALGKDFGCVAFAKARQKDKT